MKRRGPGLGEAPGTRMQPRARAAWSRLPPGRLNWGTAASAGPERSAAGASRTWSFRTAGPCRRRASSLGVLRAPVRQPRCLTVQPRRLTVQPARTPRSPVPFVSSRRWKPTENTPVACAQSRGGLATGWSLTWSLSPPPKKKIRSDYQLLNSPAVLGRGQRSGSFCRWERCHQTAASQPDYPHSLFLGSEIPSPQFDRF